MSEQPPDPCFEAWLENAADETTGGPAFFTLVDPDGNPVLIDQHVSQPTKH